MRDARKTGSSFSVLPAGIVVMYSVLNLDDVHTHYMHIVDARARSIAKLISDWPMCWRSLPYVRGRWSEEAVLEGKTRPR